MDHVHAPCIRETIERVVEHCKCGASRPKGRTQWEAKGDSVRPPILADDPIVSLRRLAAVAREFLGAVNEPDDYERAEHRLRVALDYAEADIAACDCPTKPGSATEGGGR